MQVSGLARRPAALVTRAGGAMLVAAGVPQVSGAWTAAMRWLRVRWACGCGLSL